MSSRGVRLALVTLSLAWAGCGPRDAPTDAASSDAPLDAPRYVLSIEPELVDLGDVCVGDASRSVDITLTNEGSAPVSGLDLSIGGADAEDFRVELSTCTGELTVGATCTITVGATPSAAGRASARLDVTHEGSTRSAMVSVNGVFCDTALSIAPTPERFGDVLVGDTSAPHTFTLRWLEPGSFTRLDASLAGSDASAFRVTRDGCSGDVDPAATECTLDVVCAPVAPGTLVTLLDVTSVPAGGAVASLGCTGLPRVADVTITPDAQSFGSVSPPCLGASQVFTITSSGTIPTGPLTSTLGGRDASSFSFVRDDCAAGLAVGETCEVEVRFTPVSIGDLVASLDVEVAGRTRSATLTGSGLTDGIGLVTTTPSLHDYGSVAVGTRSAPARFTLVNPGCAPTGVLTASIAGANPDDFEIDPATSTCGGAPLGGGERCVVDVVFAPTALGARSASLRVTAVPGGVTSTALSGTGL